jgi:hypothetical protein
MASWMALPTSRDIDVCLLLLLLRRRSDVGLTKISMCLGVATAHARYLPGSQGACAAGRPVSRTGAPRSGKAAKWRHGAAIK